MGLMYRIAADLVVTLHMAYVLFVVVGFVLILAGCLFRWQWIRNAWFRTIHLACIVLVAAEALLGIPCPLTVWEHSLRRLAGQTTYRGDFIANWTHELLFFDIPPWVFTLIYTAFAALVLLTFLLAPPRRFLRRDRNSAPGRQAQGEG